MDTFKLLVEQRALVKLRESQNKKSRMWERDLERGDDRGRNKGGVGDSKQNGLYTYMSKSEFNQ